MGKTKIAKQKYCISLSDRDIMLLDLMRTQESKTRSALISDLIKKQAKKTKIDKNVTEGGALIF